MESKRSPHLFINHGIGYDNLKKFAQRRNIPFDKLEGGFCKAASLLNLAYYLFITSENKPPDVPKHVTQFLLEIAKNWHLINIKMDWEKSQESDSSHSSLVRLTKMGEIESAYEKMFIILETLQPVHRVITEKEEKEVKKFSPDKDKGGEAIASLLFLLNLDPSTILLSGGVPIICEKPTDLNEISHLIFGDEAMYIACNPIHSSKKDDFTGHDTFISRSKDGTFTLYDPNLKEAKIFKSEKTLADAIFSSYSMLSPFILQIYGCNLLPKKEMKSEQAVESQLIEKHKSNTYLLSLMAVEAAKSGNLSFMHTVLKQGVLLSSILRFSAERGSIEGTKAILSAYQKNPEFFLVSDQKISHHDPLMAKGLLLAAKCGSVTLWDLYKKSGVNLEESILYFSKKENAEENIGQLLKMALMQNQISASLLQLPITLIGKPLDKEKLLKQYENLLETAIGIGSGLKMIGHLLTGIILLQDPSFTIESDMKDYPDLEDSCDPIILNAVKWAEKHKNMDLLNTLFQWCAQDIEYIELSKHLIEAKVSINYSGTSDETVLHTAIRSGNFLLAQAILLNGGSINIPDVDGITSLQLLETYVAEDKGIEYSELLTLAREKASLSSNLTPSGKGEAKLEKKPQPSSETPSSSREQEPPAPHAESPPAKRGSS